VNNGAVRRNGLHIAMLSVHTCPLAMMGGKKTGGMNVYVRDLSRELGRLGFQVDVFTRSQDDCQPRIKHDLGYGARVIHVPAGPELPIPVVEVGHYLDEFVAGVERFVEAEGVTYDLIHSHYWLSGLVAQRLQAKWLQADGRRRPIIHMFHTLGHMKNRVAQTIEEMAAPERIDGEIEVLAAVDRIVVATPAEQAQLKWLYHADTEKTVIIPPGVDLERFRPISRREAKERIGIPIQDKNILFAGRIEPLKGIDTLLVAISMIQECAPEAVKNVCVAIIGGDPWADDPEPEMARLQQLRARLRIHDLVTFLGAKDQEALPDFYAAAEMVVVPSHYESFGMVALEAMAMGRPVIASEVGGLAFLVRDNETGFHVPSRDPEALAEKIFQLLTEPACGELLGGNARRYAEQYAWPHIAGRMVALYQDCLNEAVAAPTPPPPPAALSVTN
jgi:D-inositol-3-phosphate glycosyltransferase